MPLGLAVLAALIGVDVILGPSPVITGTFLMAPFVCAVFGGPRATALVAGVTILMGATSPVWQDDGGLPYAIRLVAIVVAGAFAVAGAHARDRWRGNAGRLRLLDSISEFADGSLPLAQTLTRVTELIVPEAADMCMIDAINEGRVVRAAVRVQGVPNAAEVEDRLRSRPPSIPGRFVSAEPAWTRIAHFRPRMDAEDLRRMAAGPEDLEFLKSLRPRSSIVAAMTARGRTLGTLTLVTTWSKRRYTADDVSFAQVLARRIGLALDNAGLFSDLESVERRLDTVMSMLNEAITVHDASGDLVYANHAAARLVGFTTPQEVVEATEHELLGRLEIWAEDGTRLDRDRIAQRLRAGRLPQREQVRLALGAGSVERWAVVSSEPIEAPDGSLLYAVTTIEDVTELKRSELAQQLLARAGELLGASIDYQHTLQAIARVAVPQFADWCCVNILDQSGDLQQAAVAHRDPGRVAGARQLGERYPVRMGDKARVIQGVGPGSAVAVPMAAGAKEIGVLVFGSDSSSRSFEENDLEIAVEIARRAGIALENARLAGEQAEVARVLQRGLRPAELPAMRGFEVATMYRPAGEVNEVGGDFYEAFEIEGGWMLAIGDVVGHGAAAASVTALARYTIRTAGKLTGDPRAAALMLDESLKRRTDLSLCSAILLVLPDADDDPVEASLLVAGHPLPLLVRAGEMNPVGQPGPLAGTLDQPQWRVTPLKLSRGDQLVLYTDGVTEARGESDRFGDHRLRTSLSAVSNPTETVARIESALDSFLAGPSQDDAAALVLLRSGNTRPGRPSEPRVQAATSTGGGHDGFGRGAAG
ncbi:MAG: SpoIIE family protein phosphatase [Actinomycetota bacterium]